ncbi:ribonuclease H-like domain-containing protein [Tanacetum coccineum]
MNRSRIGINKWYQSFALRNFDLEDMEFEFTNSNTTAKLPILKLAQEHGTSVTKMSIPVTAEEKTNKKNDVKARSLILMALPNENQLTFDQYPDAKTMFAAIEHDLEKIVSSLAILGVVIAQEDLNSKILSSLPPEWITHVVVWMNKPEVENMSIDDLYNNFKFFEQKVKKFVGASSGAQNKAFMTASSTSSTNDANTASPQVSTASFSDNVVYAFMVGNPNGSNLLHQDLEKIHEDDLEAIDLKWQLSLLNNLKNRSRIGINKWYQSFALRNFDPEDMEFESTNSNTTSKLPILKLATKKTRKTLLKQQYENFSASSAESLDSIFNRFQKIVSRLAILGVVFAQEDLNLKFLSSLPLEWNTLVVVWMNKPEIETMSIDDLYNNFKIVEQMVKKFVSASSVSTASFSNNAVYAFMVENPNISNLLHQDLKQIHEDDLEAMDLKWQLSLLSMRAKRYYHRTGKKNFINANDTARYDKSKVVCLNYHKMGHFARECRASRSKEGQFRNQDNIRKQGNNEDTSSKAMLAIDGVGFDWSDMAEEQVQTNMALMTFSNSEVYNDKTCSKTYLKNYETLKKQCDDLIVKLNQTEFTATTYKRGLATVEEQLITYRKNEVLFSEEVAVLKRVVACKDYEINVLKSEFEKVKQKKEGIEFKIEKFDKASKDLDKLLESQITNKSKKGLGYSVVPPPHPLIYNRPKKLDLSYSGLDELKEPEFKGYGSEVSKKESNVVYDKKSDDSKENYDNSLEKEQVSKDTSSFVESSPNVDKETIFPVDKKGESKELEWEEVQSTRKTHPNAQRNMVPRAVLMKTGLKTFNTARTVNTAHPKSIVFNAKPMSCFPKIVQSTVRRPFQSKAALSNKRFTHKVNTAKAQEVNTSRPQAVNIARPKIVKTARLNIAVVNAVRVNQANAVKASACWVRRPTKPNGASITLKKHNYIDAPMQIQIFVDGGLLKATWTGNIAYLSDFKECDGGYVTFRGGAHGGRIYGSNTELLDETSEILKNFIKEIENLVDKKVKIIRSDNGTESERRNKILIEAARTMLADSKLPTTFWAEAVSTACYVQNRILVVKPHNKTPYELFRGLETDIREKDEKQSQKRQNRARNGRASKSQSQSQPEKVKGQSRCRNEEIFNGPTGTHLMGRHPVIHQPIHEKTCAELLAEEWAVSINTQPPQEETSLEFLQDKRNLINSVQTFLRKFNRFSFYETPKVISLAWETILEIEHAFEDKQYQPEGILELFRKLHNDVQNIHEELAEYINTPNLNRPTVYYDDDDDEDYTIAITPVLSTKEPESMGRASRHCSSNGIRRNRNKIYDPRICIEVESTRFLATLSPMIDTLLPFSSKNEEKVFNHGVLASKEKSSSSSSHWGFKASKLFIVKAQC